MVPPMAGFDAGSARGPGPFDAATGKVSLGSLGAEIRVGQGFDFPPIHLAAVVASIEVAQARHPHATPEPFEVPRDRQHDIAALGLHLPLSRLYGPQMGLGVATAPPRGSPISVRARGVATENKLTQKQERDRRPRSLCLSEAMAVASRVGPLAGHQSRRSCRRRSGSTLAYWPPQ